MLNLDINEQNILSIEPNMEIYMEVHGDTKGYEVYKDKDDSWDLVAINDKDYIYEFKNSNITSDKVNLNDIYYLEIKKEILSSNKVYLEIKLRNKVYRYKIK